MNSRLPGIEPSSSWRADFGGEAKYLSLCRGTEIVCGGCTKGERCSRGEVTLECGFANWVKVMRVMGSQWLTNIRATRHLGAESARILTTASVSPGESLWWQSSPRTADGLNQKHQSSLRQSQATIITYTALRDCETGRTEICMSPRRTLMSPNVWSWSVHATRSLPFTAWPEGTTSTSRSAVLMRWCVMPFAKS